MPSDHASVSVASPALDKLRGNTKLATPSNAISALRVLLTIPAVYAIFEGSLGLAAAICALAYITDILDGWLARKLHEVSEAGKVIDPLADKLYIGAVIVAMVMKGLVPVWFVTFVLVRDLAIMLAGIWATRRFHVVLPSNYPGKAAALTIAMTLFLTLLGVSTTVLVLMQILSAILMLISLGAYTARLLKLLKEA